MRVWGILIGLAIAAPLQAQDAFRVGVFGTVETVSPLVVAGQRIDLPEGLPVISPLGTGQSILQGETVAVRSEVVDGRLIAERILKIYPVVGPVARVEGATAFIMGTPVHIPPGETLAPDDWIAVGGLWSADTVISTRFLSVERGSFAQLAGAADANEMRIGGSDVSGAQMLEKGFGRDVWTLSGSPEKGGLRVRLMSKGVFGRAVDLVLWQGYASLPVASQTYMIHGTGITGTARDAQMPQAGELILRCVREGQVVSTAPDGLEPAFAALGCARHTPAD